MARGVNKVILVGTAGKDPETRYTAAGSAISSVSLATNESWTDKATGERQERTEWTRVQFFGRTAEVVSEYVRKGSQIYVEGRLRTDKYTDKEGIERYQTSVIADEMQLLGGNQTSEARPAARAPAAQAPAHRAPAAKATGRAAPPADFDDDLDSIPF